MENQKNDDVPRVKSADDIAAIAKRLNISFLHISTVQELLLFQRNSERASQDPLADVLVMVTGAAFKLIDPEHYYADCFLRYKGRESVMAWTGESTYASFIKSMLNRDDSCCICYETESHYFKKICPECAAQLCAKCVFKISVAGGNMFEYACPLCRKVNPYNPFVWYLVLLDQLDQMNEEEQAHLVRIQEADPWRNERQQKWLEMRKFKEGARVRVHGLQRRKDLNNRDGLIAADHVQQKCGEGRWPVWMEDKNGGEDFIVSIKESNLNVMCNMVEIHAEFVRNH